MMLFSGDNESRITQKLLKTTQKFVKRIMNELDHLVDNKELLDEILNNSLFKMICKNVNFDV